MLNKAATIHATASGFMGPPSWFVAGSIGLRNAAAIAAALAQAALKILGS
jgi:hypothetical protein